MFRANFQRTGVYQTAGVRQLRGLKWKFRQLPDLGGTIPGINRGLAIGNGIVCVQATGGNLYGLDVQTGRQLWLHQIGEGTKVSYPSIADGIFYFGVRQSNQRTTNEYLYAINIQSGQQKWKTTLPLQQFFPSFASAFCSSSPAVANGIVYIGSSNGNLYAIDTFSGELVWNFKTTQNMPLTSPAVNENILCICSNDGYLYTIDLTSKEQKWKFEIGAISIFSSSPVIANEKVYITSSDGSFYALNLQTGESLWTFNAGNVPFHNPAVTERIACIVGGEDFLYAIDLDTGKQLWKYRTENARYWSSPIIVQNTVYLGTQGFLSAIDLETGEQIWQFQTPLSDQWVLDPQMWLYGLGNQLTKIFTGNTHNLERFSEPAIVDGVIYVNCSNGYFYALH